MKWPTWGKPPETRADSSFTDALVAAIVTGAGGSASGIPTATAALEACAGFVSRAFASAELPEGVEIPPSTLALIGRDLIRRGESLHLVEVAGGEVMLRPVGSWDVRGGPHEQDWWYRCDLFGPSGNVSRFVPSAAVVHVRYAVDAARPYYGLGPIQIAAAAGRLAAATSASLADEAGRPHGSFLVLPDPSKADTISAQIKTAQGKVLGVEGGDWNVEQGGMNRAEFSEKRFGADPPAGLVAIHAQAFDQVCAACGLTGLFSAGSDSAGRREAYRQALHTVIAPLGRIVAHELTAKMDRPIVLDWAELKAGDIAGRSRAFASLVNGGMSLQDAAAASGVLMGETP